MTTGFDHARDILCESGPGSASSRGASDLDKPNVFCGMRMDGIGAGSFAMGTSDFAIEYWLCNKAYELGDPSHQGQTIVGFASIVSSAVFFRAGANHSGMTPVGQYFDGVGRVSTGDGPIEVDWHHYVLNYDRSGNLSLIMDGATQGTVAINTTSLASFPFYPLSGLNSGDEDDLVFLARVGPVAVHSGTLLTAAQINTSIQNRYVNNLSQTILLYDWKGIFGHTGWTTGDPVNTTLEDEENALATELPGAITYRLRDPFYAPVGANGTVVVPDLSGSGNDFAVPTAATYTAVSYTSSSLGNPQAAQAQAIFGSDHFFSSGGGLRWL